MTKSAALRRVRASQNGGTMLSHARRLVAIGSILVAGIAAQPALADAPASGLPSGAVVTVGSAQINSSATNTTINQSSTRAVINWTGFSVSAGNSATFNQPDAQSATLNRVTGAASSTIAGQITSNGAVYLVNPNGIAITPSGAIDTGGGFVASTLDIADGDFMGGKLAFAGRGASANVTNAGTIRSGAGGIVALLGGSVANSGSITVPLGKVGLGSGEKIALDLNGGNFLQVAVPTGSLGSAALVDNSGTIAVAGGSVVLSAATVKNAIRNVINMSGAISADSAVADGGVIRLLGGDGGTVTASGTLSARATGAAGNGGTVETSGAAVDFTGLRVDTRAATGKTGTWLVDPTDLNVDQTAADTISANLLTSNVELDTFADGTTSGPGTPTTGAGDININGVINWNSNNNLTINAFNDVNFNAALHWTGDGVAANGLFNVIAGRDINFNAPIDWNKGFGLFFNAFHDINVRAALTSTTNTFLQFTADDTGTGEGTVSFQTTRTGAGSLTTGGAIVNVFYNPQSYDNPTDFSQTIPAFNGVTGSTLFPYMLVNTANDLQAVSTNLAGFYGMVRDIIAGSTASWNNGAGFAPLGVDSNGNILGNGFTGLFYGQGHSITGLYINRPGVTNVGLFGYLSGMLSGVSLSAVNVTGGSNVGAAVGTLSSAVAGSCLCGPNSVNRVEVIGTVTGVNSADTTGNFFANVGGVVGFADGIINDSTLVSSDVTGGNGVGGIVGRLNSGEINRSSSDFGSTVTGLPNVGGVVGAMASGRLTSVSSGAYVTGINGTGGVIGTTFGGTITNSSSTTNAVVIGQSNVGGFVGVIGASVTIDNSTSGALVTGNPDTGTAIGGFIGSLATAALITNSSYTGPDTGSSPNVSGAAFVGGFVGSINNGGTFTGDFAQAVVTGIDRIGGFAGFASGATLTNITVNALTSGQSNIGGAIGQAVNATALSSVTTNGFTGGASSVGGIAGQLLGGSSITSSTSNAQVISQDIDAGGLVGYLSIGTVTGSTATGPVRGPAYVGGLVGNINGGAVFNSSATGTATVTGSDIENSYWIGGLVGHASGATISGSSAAGAVKGNAQVGGLVGYLEFDSSISLSNASGAVTGTGTRNANFDIGGLVGYNAGEIDSSSASGAVRGFLYLGGLVGWHDYAGTITNSHATGSVAGLPVSTATGLTTTGNDKGIPFQFDHAYDIGGLVGVSDGTVDQSYATGDVGVQITGSRDTLGALAGENIGGLAGEAGGNITRSQASGNVGGGVSVGGLVGTVDHVTIDGSSASGLVIGANNVGGLVGTSDGTISNSSATGPITGTNSVGGLLGAGTSGSLVTLSTASSPVVLGAGTGGGGLVGFDYGTITLSYAAGAVSGFSGSNSLGGLVGVLNGSQAAGTVRDAYATGSVSGDNIVGGLVGSNTGSVSRTYAVGAVSGNTQVGGLVGWNLGTSSAVSSSYWDTTTTTRVSGFGKNDGSFTGAGRTTAQMQDLNAFQANYAGFDFFNVWSPPNQSGQGGDTTPHYPELYALSLVAWIHPDDATKVYGNANPTFTYGVSGLRNGDSLAVAPQLVSAANAASNVGLYAINQSGAQGPAGYRLVLTNGTLTVIPRGLSLTADPLSRLYGGINPTTDTATADPVTATSGLVNGDSIASVNVTSTATASSGVGSYSLFASNAVFSQGQSSNYAISYNANPTGLTITPAPLRVTYTANAASRLYGQANPPLSGSVAASGLVNGDQLGAVTSGTAVFTTDATATSNVGQYAIMGSGLTGISPNYNYSFAQAPGNFSALTITPAQLTTVVTASLVGIVSKTYDGTNLATLTPDNFLLAGFMNGEGATVTRASGTYASANAGTGLLVTTALTSGDFLANSGTNLGNYILPTTASGRIGTILPAPLTIAYRANAVRRTYGQSNPLVSGTTTATGLVGRDSLSTVTSGFASFSTLASSTSNVGTYAITGSGLVGTSGNYSYTFVQAPSNFSALTVTPASLIIYYTANSAQTLSGQAVARLSGSVLAVGLVNGDTVGSVTTGAANFTTAATASSGAGAYAITGSGLIAASANYAIRFLQSPSNSFAYTVLPTSRTRH